MGTSRCCFTKFFFDSSTVVYTIYCECVVIYRNISLVLKVSAGSVLMVHFSMFRSDYECFQIELSKNYGQTEWREDIKSIMLKAGLKNQQITFLFVDTQVNLS